MEWKGTSGKGRISQTKGSSRDGGRARKKAKGREGKGKKVMFDGLAGTSSRKTAYCQLLPAVCRCVRRNGKSLVEGSEIFVGYALAVDSTVQRRYAAFPASDRSGDTIEEDQWTNGNLE